MGTNTANMTMYSNQMSSAWKNRIAKENLKVLEGLNMVPKQSSRRDESGRGDTNTPAHHSAPFACDIVPNNKNNNNNNNNNRSRQSTSRSSRPSTSATRPGTSASRPSTSASRQSCDSFASGRSSHRADQADWNQQSSRTAGLGAEHEVLKKIQTSRTSRRLSCSTRYIQQPRVDGQMTRQMTLTERADLSDQSTQADI